MSAPWRGSKAAQLVSDMCLKGSVFDKAMKKIADLLHWQYCQPDKQPNAAYASLLLAILDLVQTLLLLNDSYRSLYAAPVLGALQQSTALLLRP